MKIALDDRPTASQKPALKQMYPPKPKPPVPPRLASPQKALTVRDCWRNILFLSLVVLYFTVEAVQDFSHKHDLLKTLPHALQSLIWVAWSVMAWQNLRRVRRGETVYGMHLTPREEWQVAVVIGLVFGSIILFFVTCMDIAKWVDFPQRIHLWPDGIGVCLAWPAIIWGWAHLPKSDDQS